MNDLVSLFEGIGLDAKKAAETAGNKKLAANLAGTIEEAAGAAGTATFDKAVGALLYALAATCPRAAEAHRSYIARRVSSGDIKSEEQMQAAFAFVAKLPQATDAAIDGAAFDAACGVGSVIEEATIRMEVEGLIERHREGLVRDRYAYSAMSHLMKELKACPALRWADRKAVKDALDGALLGLLGERESAEEIRKMKRSVAAAAAASSQPSTPSSAAGSYATSTLGEDGASPATTPTTGPSGSAIRTFVGEVALLHKPGENPQLSEDIRQAHLRATGGRVVTRFPPEPNGFLHIGHAKAINLNFKYAEAFGGICYLRMDDTNPEAEVPAFYEAIKESVSWLGFTPYAVTAASDYFEELYEIAMRLVRNGDAYVCHMTQEEITLSRGGPDGKLPRYNSPWRNRPVAENVAEFERMRDGAYENGQATLRLKQDISCGNPFMWDLVAYRVLKQAHCRTGSKWCIYPMYDFTHCLCDSIENITHSMCTTEFINAREAYYWVCDKARVYKAVQWEYGRLNITNTILSKRKLTKLVEEGVIPGWDDPRVYTLAGLRRRGFPPQAINAFVEELGVTTAFSVVDVKKLEGHVRAYLNATTVRRMAILDPITVHITNIAEGTIEMVTLENDPRDPAKGTSQLPLTNVIYIDRADFDPCLARDGEAEEEYFRLTPKQAVGLYKVGVLSCTAYTLDPESGRVTSLEATIDRSASPAVKPKTFITWLPECKEHNSPLRGEVRLYGPLFKSRNPSAVPGGFMADLNENSLTTISEALLDPRLAGAVAEEKFQFQRVGYFCVDSDSRGSDHLVFNLTVPLKEDLCKS